MPASELHQSNPHYLLSPIVLLHVVENVQIGKLDNSKGRARFWSRARALRILVLHLFSVVLVRHRNSHLYVKTLKLQACYV